MNYRLFLRLVTRHPRLHAILTGLPGWLRDARSPAARPWLAMLVAGLVVTLALVILVRRLEDQSTRATLTRAAEVRLSLLDSALARVVDAVVNVAAVFDGQNNVTRGQFAQLAQPILARQGAIRALEWVPVVRPGELAGLSATARQEGYPDFALREFDPAQPKVLRPLTPRAEYFPVWYFEPEAANLRVFGLDIGSDGVRNAVLQASRRRGEMLLSPRIDLAQEPGRVPGAVLVRPVYRKPRIPAVRAAATSAPGPAPDPAALAGFVLAVLRIDRLGAEPPQLQRHWPLTLQLFDDTRDGNMEVLFPAHSAQAQTSAPAAGFRLERHFFVGGRQWLAVVQAPAGPLRTERTASSVVLLAGALISLLLARLQFQSQFRATAIRDTVERRTGELLASERRLIQLHQEALLTARGKTVFMASLTHEFRTPMNAIIGLLDALRRSPLGPAQQDQVDKTRSAAQRLLRLVEDILDLSRIEAGRLTLDRQPFALESVLRDVLVASVPRLGNKPVELICDADPQLPAGLIGDGMRLTQILVNLTENAAKFTRRGDVVLRVRPGERAARHIDLHFTVSDTGPGLNERDLARLFQPFVQAEQGPLREHAGAGLGLSIARQLVELLGGTLQVESRVGQGTRMAFTLNFGIADPAPLVTPLLHQVPPRVLLLEPHGGAAASLQTLLQAAGAQVTWLAGPAELPRLPPDSAFGLVLVAEGFPVDAAVQAQLARLPQVRVQPLMRAGHSLRALTAERVPEKPLLPGAVHALLQAFGAQARQAQADGPDRA